MDDSCIYCKYHSSVDGLDACAYKSGLVANRHTCESYTKSWSTYIALNLGFVMFLIIIFGVPIFLIYLFLKSFGVI